MPEATVQNLAYVEVRKNVESTTWYDAFLQDLLGERVVVSFENEVWPDRELPCYSVRGRPSSMPDEQAAAVAELQAGDPVEVRVAASARNPRGWALGRLVATKDGFFEVQLEGVKAGLDKDLILQADALRPVSREAYLNPLYVLRRAVLIDEELRDWLSSLDAKGCVEQVRQMVGLAHAGIGSDEHGIFSEASTQRTPDSVVLIGDESAVRKAHLLLQVHFMHQRDVEAFHERRRHKLNLLKELLAKGGNAAAQLSFLIDADLVGRMLGKGGENAKRVEREHGVEVRVANGDDADAPRTVRISGDSDEAIEKARVELEILRVEYPIEDDMIEWVKGKGRADILDIGVKAGLFYANFNGNGLELCGLRECVEDAELLLDHLMDYFPIHQSMEQQHDEIQQSFEALDIIAVNTGARLPPSQRRRAESPTSKSNEKGKERSYPSAVQSNGGDLNEGRGNGRGRRGGRQSSNAANPQVTDQLNPTESPPPDDRAAVQSNEVDSNEGRGSGRGGRQGGRQTSNAASVQVADDSNLRESPPSDNRAIGDSGRARGGRRGGRGRGPIGAGSTEGKAIWKARKSPEAT